MTKHTCGGPKFGRLTSGCPSCDELLSGRRAPIKQAWRASYARQEQDRTHAIRTHNCKTSNCGPVCTAFEW